MTAIFSPARPSTKRSNARVGTAGRRHAEPDQAFDHDEGDQELYDEDDHDDEQDEDDADEEQEEEEEQGLLEEDEEEEVSDEDQERDDEEDDEAAYDSDGPTLAQLAERIAEAHLRCRQSHAKAAEYALKAGQLLLAAKRRVPRGQWLAWLKKNVRISPRTAQRYVRLLQLEDKLDELNGSWRTEWWPTEALELLAEPANGGDAV
jgi:hypothetical protein